jgi:hypothetical protein
MAQPDVTPSGGGGGGGGIHGSDIGHSGANGTSPSSTGLGGGGGGGPGGNNSPLGYGYGGTGGFGAGGGGGGLADLSGHGGPGGFGGGGGGGGEDLEPGAGGFGGGNGAAPQKIGSSAGGGGGLGAGGAIFAQGGSLFLINCTLTGNSATGGNGGYDSYYSGQDGSSYGGAIFTYDSTVEMQSCTITNNVAGDGGRQVYAYSSGSSARPSVTIANSILGQSGRDAVSDLGAASAAGTPLPVLAGTHNLMSNPGPFPRSALVAIGDPRLGPLRYHGGPTRTMLPRRHSPAVNAGTFFPGGALRVLPPVDQRGRPRVRGRVPDLGAVESPWRRAATAYPHRWLGRAVAAAGRGARVIVGIGS